MHAQAPTGLFGSVEFASGALVALPQWVRVLEAMRRDGPAFANCSADAAQCRSAAMRSWRTILVGAAPLDRAARIREINAAFNKWPYKLDHELFGVSEYWATPAEFLSRSGDCEDYAIAKFFALRELGFGNDELRIVALMDRIRGIGHAVLAVREGADFLVLDNLTDLVFSHTRYTHYDPQYSVNETTRWAHVKAPRKPAVTPAAR